MPFRRKVTKGVDKPVKGHFGKSPEFVSKPPEAKKPTKAVKRRKLKPNFPVRP